MIIVDGFCNSSGKCLCTGAQVSLNNVSVSYVNPSQVDTCEEHTSKAVFGLSQAFTDTNVISVNKTAGKLIGPLNITVWVTDANTNTSGATADHKVMVLLRCCDP
jgi:hypothetical protein